jgi:hypothetical protein
MNIADKSKEYAEGKALNAISAAIEEAYAEGYKAGYQDGYDTRDKISPIELEYGVSYIDLGLPSGLLWSLDYLRDKQGTTLYLTYEEAAKLNIPTKEQFKELFSNCNIFKRETTKFKGSVILGRNGNSIELQQNFMYMGNKGSLQDSYTFWLKDDEGNNNYRYCAKKYKDSQIGLEFMGCRMPVLLVR